MFGVMGAQRESGEREEPSDQEADKREDRGRRNREEEPERK